MLAVNCFDEQRIKAVRKFDTVFKGVWKPSFNLQRTLVASI